MNNELYARNSKTVGYDAETISFLSLKPQNIEKPSYFPCFKKSVRKWKPNCPCRFCNMLVLYSSAKVLSFQFLIYLTFISPVHVHVIKNYSYIIYLGICFDF